MNSPEQKPVTQERLKLAGFLDSRTKFRMLQHHLLLEPLPGGSRWAAAFGSLLMFTFVMQIVTGILLTMNYAPTVHAAFLSVVFTRKQVPLGWLIQRLHYWGSSAMVILLLLHMVQVFLWGAYKKPREFTWIFGVILLGITMALAFTGYLLPWDEQAYWASKVGMGIIGTVPLIGGSLRTLLQGGPHLGNLTLTRFYTMHILILPGLLIITLAVHLYLFRIHGVTPPWWETPERLKLQEEPFWPGQALKDGFLALLLLCILGLWCWFHPVPLAGMADPAKAYNARPAWYFMFLFELLKFFQGKYEIIGTFILPGLFFAIMLFWPFLDRNPAMSPRRRPFAVSLMAVCVFGLLGLEVFSIETSQVMPVRSLSVIRNLPMPAAAGPLQQVRAAALFSTNCAACHEVNGTGDALRVAMPKIPNFTNATWQAAQTNAAILHRIVHGKPPYMPPFGSKLTSPQIQALAVYVRHFSKATGTAKAPAPGRHAATPFSKTRPAGAPPKPRPAH